MSYAWPDDAAGKLPAQKRPREDDGEPPPAKKRRLDPGEVRLFSANTCGFDAQKWKNIEKMANDHDIDVITLQEGVLVQISKKGMRRLGCPRRNGLISLPKWAKNRNLILLKNPLMWRVCWKVSC